MCMLQYATKQSDNGAQDFQIKPVTYFRNSAGFQNGSHVLIKWA
jgi:hypothetical protein